MSREQANLSVAVTHSLWFGASRGKRGLGAAAGMDFRARCL